MPSIRLKIPQRWYREIVEAAKKHDQTPEQFLLGLVALSIPPPVLQDERAWRLPEHQALLQQVKALCQALDATRAGLATGLAALTREARQPRRNPEVAANRQMVAASLRVAMSKRKLTQGQLAEQLGVARTVITEIVNCRMSLLPAWTESLERVLGRDWMKPP